ncbi:MAG: tRNA lysidine(34) synthetase TilS [Hyphomicrobiaceae bacterium]
MRGQELDTLFAPLSAYATLILAVSGGADSVALMHLVCDWAADGQASRPGLVVATVDHGLRAGSAAEARWVGGMAQQLGLPHHVLTWTGTKPSVNVQASARAARYALLGGLAAQFQGAAIVTAHHADDQAETLLMRLARGSGADGLAAIPGRRSSMARAEGPGIAIERPLLSIPKQRLVATLRARAIGWLEDPSNANENFERVRWRRALPMLADLGLTVPALARSARRLSRARAALEQMTAQAWVAHVDLHDGVYAAIGRAGFAAEPEEIQLRVLARALAVFGGDDEPARLSQVETALARLSGEGECRLTLGGCLLEAEGHEVRVMREPERRPLPALPLVPDEELVWDGRFNVGVFMREECDICVRALGAEGVALLLHPTRGGVRSEEVDPADRVVGPEVVKRLRGLPRAAALALPSFWMGPRLVAVPHLAWHDDASFDDPPGWVRLVGTQAT